MHDFGRHTWNLWVLHYAKGPWYIALAIYAATGSIEISKAASAIAPAIALLVVLAAALDFGLERRWAILVALVTALNPVTTCGIVTHQVDGILVSLMACTAAAVMCVLLAPALAAGPRRVRVLDGGMRTRSSRGSSTSASSSSPAGWTASGVAGTSSCATRAWSSPPWS